jgi:hypothetical protein
MPVGYAAAFKYMYKQLEIGVSAPQMTRSAQLHKDCFKMIWKSAFLSDKFHCSGI